MANFQNYPQQGGQNNYGGAVNNAPMAGGVFQPQPAYGTQPAYGQAPVQQSQQPTQQAYQQPAYGGQPAQQAYPQAPVVQQQPVQQQAPVQPSQIGGTKVLKIHVNPNWKYGDKGWIAVVTIATDESLYLSNINVRNGQRGMFFSWPGQPRVQNGQPVVSQSGKPIYSNFYNPYRSKKMNYDGEAIMNQLFMPLVQQALSSADGKAFANPADPYRDSRFFRSSNQGGALAYGNIHTQKGQVTMVIPGIFVRPVYDEQEGVGINLSFPSSPKVQNGQQVIGADGKPVYNQYVLPTKETRNAIMAVVGPVVEAELAKIANQQAQQVQQPAQQQAYQQPQQQQAYQQQSVQQQQTYQQPAPACVDGVELPF